LITVEEKMAPNDYDEESSGGEESVEAKPQRKRKQKKWKVRISDRSWGSVIRTCNCFSLLL